MFYRVMQKIILFSGSIYQLGSSGQFNGKFRIFFNGCRNGFNGAGPAAMFFQTLYISVIFLIYICF